jgi:hypothetical protein
LPAADSLIVVVPEYAGMAAAAAKNLFLFGGGDLVAHKPALLVAVSSGQGGSYFVAETRASSDKNSRQREDLAETRSKVGDGTNGRGARDDVIEGMRRSPGERVRRHLTQRRDAGVAQRVIVPVAMLPGERGDGDRRERCDWARFRQHIVRMQPQPDPARAARNRHRPLWQRLPGRLGTLDSHHRRNRSVRARHAALAHRHGPRALHDRLG